MTTDQDQALLDFLEGDIPEHCQQGECSGPVQTWCPLCDLFLCLKHDELVPNRMHDCLGGPAD